MPVMRMAPSASTRAFSAASNTVRAAPGRGRDAFVDFIVVAAEVERDAIGPAAQDRDVPGRGRARRLGQLHARAAHFRPARPKRDFEFRFARDRAHGGGKHAFQRLARGFLAFGRGGGHCPMFSHNFWATQALPAGRRNRWLSGLCGRPAEIEPALRGSMQRAVDEMPVEAAVGPDGKPPRVVLDHEFPLAADVLAALQDTVAAQSCARRRRSAFSRVPAFRGSQSRRRTPSGAASREQCQGPKGRSE